MILVQTTVSNVRLPGLWPALGDELVVSCRVVVIGLQEDLFDISGIKDSFARKGPLLVRGDTVYTLLVELGLELEEA